MEIEVPTELAAMIGDFLPRSTPHEPTDARPIRRDSTMDARTYREETQYDGYGRAWKTRDASGGWLKQQFDVPEKVAESIIDAWLNNGIISYEMADKHSKIQGLKVTGSID